MQLFQFLFIILSLISCKPTVENNESEERNLTGFHTEASQFCTDSGYNSSFYFLIDYSKHSGLKRFYVYDFKQAKVIDQGLVSHGICDVYEANENPKETVKTSNRSGSHCSMLGKYKIGSRDYSNWGIHIKYWIHGLEESNKTAVERVVVLHSWSALDDEEIYPNHSALSWGCPAVSDAFMYGLDTLLQKQNDPTLLWIIK